MKTSLTTSEHRIGDWLLDLLHSQWRRLGIPFSVEQPVRPEEAIDPEALLWCSLEFFPTQPRLREQVLAWWASSDQPLLLPRIRKIAKGNDPRASIWRILDQQWKGGQAQPAEQCYGQQSVQELLDFCDSLARKVPKHDRHQHQQPGKAESTTATAILRARDAIGTDARHSILLYLLANQGGAKLRSIANWSGQSYRNISRIAQRWELANILLLEHGFARLKKPRLWEAILDLDPPNIVLLNWWRFYDACIKLLRSLSKAQAKSIPADGPVVTGLLHEATNEAEASAENSPSTESETIRSFRLLLANLR